jgi:hypothetical protein
MFGYLRGRGRGAVVALAVFIVSFASSLALLIAPVHAGSTELGCGSILSKGPGYSTEGGSCYNALAGREAIILLDLLLLAFPTLVCLVGKQLGSRRDRKEWDRRSTR